MYEEESPIENRDVVYRPLFEQTTKRISIEKILKRTPVKEMKDIPFHDCLRHVICEISKSTRDVGGRILSMEDGNKKNIQVKISLGKHHGIREDMKLRVFREVTFGLGMPSLKLISIPVDLRIIKATDDKSRAEVIRTGMEDHWVPKFQVQTGDIVVSDTHRRSLLYCEQYQLGIIHSNVFKKGLIAEENITEATHLFGRNFMKSVITSLSRLDIPMTTSNTSAPPPIGFKPKSMF